jgi:hypothetical protein
MVIKDISTMGPANKTIKIFQNEVPIGALNVMEYILLDLFQFLILKNLWGLNPNNFAVPKCAISCKKIVNVKSAANWKRAGIAYNFMCWDGNSS